MEYFKIKEDSSPEYNGDVDATHKWKLPGIYMCAECTATWGDNSRAYPSVDLTPIATIADFEEARSEPIEEYERLRALVNPFLPPGAIPKPGLAMGPLVGKATGRFGPLVSPRPWWLLVERTALEKLQAEGVRGLKGCPTQLRFRQRTPPELLELELVVAGRAHPDCLPPNPKPPCPRCGRRGLRLPDDLLLDLRTLPTDLDVFRLEDFSTVIVCTERFSETCRRLGLNGVAFHPLRAQ